MQKTYLNRWQAFGIVASIIWILSAGFFQYRANTQFIGNAVLAVYQSCVATANKKPTVDSVNCEQQAKEMHTGLLPQTSKGIIEVIVYPISFFWIQGFKTLLPITPFLKEFIKCKYKIFRHRRY